MAVSLHAASLSAWRVLQSESTTGRPALAAKAEALRTYLELELGPDKFGTLYRHMEGLSPQGDAQQAAEATLALVGEANVHFIPLVHQLIASEEALAAEA